MRKKSISTYVPGTVTVRKKSWRCLLLLEFVHRYPRLCSYCLPRAVNFTPLLISAAAAQRHQQTSPQRVVGSIFIFCRHRQLELNESCTEIFTSTVREDTVQSAKLRIYALLAFLGCAERQVNPTGSLNRECSPSASTLALQEVEGAICLQSFDPGNFVFPFVNTHMCVRGVCVCARMLCVRAWVIT